KAHSRIDATAVANRRKGTTVSQVTGHEFQGRQIFSEELGSALRAILMIDSVKSIATNSLRKPFVRAGIDGRCFRQSAVKTGVEHGDLENRAHMFLDDLDPFQLGAIVERRKGRHARYCGLYVRRNYGGFFEILATVHDTMTDYVDLRRSGNDAQFSVP